ncbi:hypothetical protein [Alienimonas chondri]|uniref:Uncharacterized protein n=1 Tax=Alienimonas chondri TaxID=2681879 RepID=A0ABX1VGF1_9PLAN|nr:hypothetical protein [Alienimonas chondri]NNJ27204.1 hypothetical protein [Alienimonas chondri]
MTVDVVFFILAAAVVALGAAWALLLLGCLRARGRAVQGRRWLMAAGALGSVGAASGVSLFYLVSARSAAGQELAEALFLLLLVTEPLALISAAWGLRRTWRQLEGWTDR